MLKKKNTPKELAMMPPKKWLTTDEAAAYLGIGRTKFWEAKKENSLTISYSFGKEYFKVAELDGLIEKNVSVKKVA